MPPPLRPLGEGRRAQLGLEAAAIEREVAVRARRKAAICVAASMPKKEISSSSLFLLSPLPRLSKPLPTHLSNTKARGRVFACLSRRRKPQAGERKKGGEATR